MATESDLRDLLQGPDPEGRAAIDVDAVLRRARRRRRPRMIAAQALGSVAAVGVLVTGVAVSLPQETPASLLVAEDSAGGADEAASAPFDAESGADLRMPAETCGAPYVDPAGTLGWELDLAPLTAAAGESLAVPVTLSNTGETATSVVAAAPRIVITQAGTVVGHAPAVDAAGTPLLLEPGAQAAFEAIVEPYACDPEDPAAPIEDLALLAPGEYEMRPVIVVADDAGTLTTVGGTPRSLRID